MSSQHCEQDENYFISTKSENGKINWTKYKTSDLNMFVKHYLKNTYRDAFNVDLEWAIGLNRFALEVSGLWPESNQSPFRQLLFNIRTVVILITLIFVITIPTYASLVRVWGDMMLIIDNLQISLPVTMTVIKILIMWSKKDALASVVCMIVDDWVRSKTESKREIMIKQAGRARMIIVFGYTLMVSSLFIIIVPPCFGFSLRYVTNLTDPGRVLLFQTYYPFNIEKSPLFEFMFVTQSVAALMAAFSYTGIDNFLGLVILHICGQMEVLSRRITRLNRGQDFSVTLMVNITDHLRLIRCVDIIESTFHLMLLGLLFYFTIIFCLQGFLIITVINQGGNVPVTRLCWLVSIILNVFVHMAIYCIVGEVLLSKSEEIHRATYNNQWYLLHPTEARNLMLIMLRSERPLYISAGKMFPMTMATFCSLLKTSAGYISVLLARN